MTYEVELKGEDDDWMAQVVVGDMTILVVNGQTLSATLLDVQFAIDRYEQGKVAQS